MPAVDASDAIRVVLPKRVRKAARVSGDAFREFSATISRAQETAALAGTDAHRSDAIPDSYLDDAWLARMPAEAILARLDRNIRRRHRVAVACRLATLLVLLGLMTAAAPTV
jgi:hypothetical protein